MLLLVHSYWWACEHWEGEEPGGQELRQRECLEKLSLVVWESANKGAPAHLYEGREIRYYITDLSGLETIYYCTFVVRGQWQINGQRLP